MAILAGSGAFEKSVLNSAIDEGKARNIAIVTQQTYDRGLTDFRPILNGFKAKAPEAVMLVGYQEDSVAVMRQAKEIGLNPKLFAGGAAGFALPEFMTGAGDASEFVVTATAWVPEMKTPGNPKLYTGLITQLNGLEPTYHAAQAHSSVLVAAEAIKKAGSATDREAINKALQVLDIQTPYGRVKFENYSGYRGQNRLGMVAQQVQRNARGKLEFVPVYPKSLFNAKMLFPTPAWEKR